MTYPDFSDVVHTTARNWHGPTPAPTSRPWAADAGIGDDDPVGNGQTNAELEAKLEEARANGQVVHFRNMLGPLQWKGEARRRITQEYRQMYPNGCGCRQCRTK
jgi:hypothetical protein